MILDNLIYGAIVGAIVHFIAMGFSLKVSKKILNCTFYCNGIFVENF
jgi:hypothetical protein